jgi:hypothetical protein
VILKKVIEAAAKSKIFARNFSCGDLPVRDVLLGG